MKKVFKKMVPLMLGIMITLVSVFADQNALTVFADGIVTVTVECDYDAAYQVLAIVNQERAKGGLQPLAMDKDLLTIAMKRAAETAVYWDHTRPNGKSCFTVTEGDITWRGGYRGENIAYGQRNASEVMSAWMNSDGHRRNIMKMAYTSIGVGIVWSNGTPYWVQCFSDIKANDPQKSGRVTQSFYVSTTSGQEGPASPSSGGGAFGGGDELSDDDETYFDAYIPSSGENFLSNYKGYDFYINSNGVVRAEDENTGTPAINKFLCDGTYTYFFQADGTAMRNRLSYHPDGDPKHVIYFNKYGHEVFSNFHHVKQSIAGSAVDDYCFFDVYGYLYVDVVTYDKAGKQLYYANPYGVLERTGWFQFSPNVKCADGTPWNGAAGNYGFANKNATLVVNQYGTDWMGRPVYIQGNAVALYY